MNREIMNAEKRLMNQIALTLSICFGVCLCQSAWGQQARQMHFDNGVVGVLDDINPVSYTHLTLPTICSV